MRASSRLGAALLFVLATAIAACTTETIAEDDPDVASGGASGSSGAAHTAGRPNTAGRNSIDDAGSAGEAGDATVGGGQNGGSAGLGSAGLGNGGTPIQQGGTGGIGGMTGATCGNKQVEAGEECDDGNTKDGDGCSATCTNTCEKCEQKRCTTSDQLKPSFDACFGDGPIGKMPALDGPGSGTPKSTLCQALVACARRTKCAQQKDGNFTPCLCGTANAAECKVLGGAKGPCADEVAAAAETREFSDIQQRFFKTTYAVGMANQVLLDCDGSACARECRDGKSTTACEDCALGPDPTAFNFGLGCADYHNCYFDASVSALCAPAAECALSTGCGVHGALGCYGGGTGPCAKEFAAAAQSTDPETIVKNFALDYPVNRAAGMLACEATRCQPSCFKNATACDKCRLGQMASNGVLACPSYNDCYFNPAYMSTCAPAADCALSTGCGANGAVACYGSGTGPCAKEFAAASKSTDPATVVANFDDGTFASHFAAALLACDSKSCKTECGGAP